MGCEKHLDHSVYCKSLMFRLQIQCVCPQPLFHTPDPTLNNFTRVQAYLARINSYMSIVIDRASDIVFYFLLCCFIHIFIVIFFNILPSSQFRLEHAFFLKLNSFLLCMWVYTMGTLSMHVLNWFFVIRHLKVTDALNRLKCNNCMEMFILTIEINDK